MISLRPTSTHAEVHFIPILREFCGRYSELLRHIFEAIFDLNIIPSLGSF